MQHQRAVGYVFAGSEPTLMERMIGPRRPFYKAGPVLRLGRIPEDVFAAFIEERFRASGIPAEAGLGDGDRRSRRATCPMTCSGWRTKHGMMRGPRAGRR